MAAILAGSWQLFGLIIWRWLTIVTLKNSTDAYNKKVSMITLLPTLVLDC
jgi:hypothetical protein